MIDVSTQLPYGKRIKNPVDDITMYYRFIPDERQGLTPEVKTLPAGKPSPKITGILPSGWYEVEGDEGGRYYIQDLPGNEIVSPDAEDDSSYFSGLFSWVGDSVGNTVDDIERKGGFLSEGFQKSVKSIKEDITGFGSYARLGILIAVPVVMLILIMLFLIRTR